MPFDKDTVSYRYMLDIVNGILHDLRGPLSPDNSSCAFDRIEHWVVFDTDREPLKGALIKKLTTTKEVVGIEVKSLCSHCMSPEDEDIVDLLKDYFLAGSK